MTVKFLIVGAMKAGTTSLHHCLKQHPDLTAARRKEVHYFDDRKGSKCGGNYIYRGGEWYDRQFPEGPNKFESSPMYLFHPLAPERIAKYNPNMKIIILLRDPVWRAISHYYHSVRKGHEKLPMLEAFKAEDRRIAGQPFNSKEYQWFSYLKRGIYLPQLERYDQAGLDYRIWSSEQLFADTQKVADSVFDYIGVDRLKVDTTPKNLGLPETANEATIKFLVEYFEEHMTAHAWRNVRFVDAC